MFSFLVVSYKTKIMLLYSLPGSLEEEGGLELEAMAAVYKLIRVRADNICCGGNSDLPGRKWRALRRCRK